MAEREEARAQGKRRADRVIIINRRALAALLSASALEYKEQQVLGEILHRALQL